MGKISGLTGTPWHAEIVGNSEDEDRRHRARCSFYTNIKKNHCNYYNEKCRGSAHCTAYKEKTVDMNTEQTLRNDVKPWGILWVYKL